MGEYEIDEELMEHYKKIAVEKANEYSIDETVEFSEFISREIEHYSDRWHPARVEYINIMFDELTEKLRKHMAYKESQWISRKDFIGGTNNDKK